ncbi:galactosyl transferase GMA12/MNN10 domain protein [Trinickia violacea]|uniref:Galactosyl transferase GMA12/MNN10 domain protein n=1 Tax=Trinickia violacea TaxID=2571746 RepID=A0A4P8J2Q0_9BURK|nr:galactosyl transferase GMA12/MNN10 domain protein [Trinickia violacea]QCP54413.1 galactosyl transferase GMA12/MNN10 domain protein [Trinickia violacea]
MIVVSHFRQPAPASLANHRQYARLYSYRHEVIDASAMPQVMPLRALHRYEVLLNTLRRTPPEQLVLLLSEDSAIIEPVALDRLMAGRDTLHVRTSSHELPQVDVQIWRNTEAVRDTVLRLIKKSRLGGNVQHSSEAALFAGLETHHYRTLIDGICVVMPTGCNCDPLWTRVPTFAISIDEMPHSPEQKSVMPRFRNVLVERINRARATGLPIFSFPEYASTPDVETAERSTYNPGRSIAITTLYTPNIGSYARIAEGNIRRYCEAQGYTLYVHRNIPHEIGLDATGNWFKPWLLHGYLQHHDWVVWLDADVLIANQQQKLEPLLEGRDWLLAHDVGQWPFNAGIVGFRRTARTDVMLRDLMAVIAKLPDTSSVYVDNGDQFHFINAMKKAEMLRDDTISDMVGINTPWVFRRPDSFIVHYYGMWNEMRVLMMAHDDALLP